MPRVIFSNQFKAVGLCEMKPPLHILTSSLTLDGIFLQAVVELGCGKAPNIKIKQLFLKTWNMDLRSDHSLCERSSVSSLSNIRTLSSSTVSCSNMTGSGGVGCDWFFFCNGILHVQNKRKLIPLTKSTCFKVTSITVQSKKREYLSCVVAARVV